MQCSSLRPISIAPRSHRETLVNYYTAVADEAPVPVLLYSMPPLTGIKIEAETVARLSEHPNIIGVKDSSNDVAGFRRTVELCPDDFAVMTGNGTVLLDALRAGATGRDSRGRMCRAGNVRRDLSCARRGACGVAAIEIDAARRPLSRRNMAIGGLKAALDMAGYRGGSVRAPLRAPDDAARAEIMRLLSV
jgi:dihydrodipicolinate synthase/N-acetylneuraminate lyase